MTLRLSRESGFGFAVLTFAEIPAAQKNAMSHRGHAFRALRG